jgi:hypothetical protein
MPSFWRPLLIFSALPAPNRPAMETPLAAVKATRQCSFSLLNLILANVSLHCCDNNDLPSRIYKLNISEPPAGATLPSNALAQPTPKPYGPCALDSFSSKTRISFIWANGCGTNPKSAATQPQPLELSRHCDGNPNRCEVSFGLGIVFQLVIGIRLRGGCIRIIKHAIAGRVRRP